MAKSETPAKPPKFGFRTAGYHEWTLRDALSSISGAGFDGVEICLEHPESRPGDMSAQRAREIASLASDAGLGVASVSYHGDFEDDATRRENQAKAVELTAHMGSRVLILNAQKAEADRLQTQWDDMRRRLDVLLPAAEINSVFVALEPEPGHFLHSSADMKRLLDQVAHPNLAVNLDVGHAFLTDPDLGDTINNLGRAIVHTHVEGMPADRHEHMVPGEGDLDLGLVWNCLEAIGYEGYYTVDLFKIADDPDGYARRSMAALRRIFRR